MLLLLLLLLLLAVSVDVAASDVASTAGVAATSALIDVIATAAAASCNFSRISTAVACETHDRLFVSVAVVDDVVVVIGI